MAKWVIRYRMSRKDRQYNGKVGNQISYVRKDRQYNGQVGNQISYV